MKKETKKIECFFNNISILMITLYYLGICLVNFLGHHWYEYDIYADAMVAKYIAESGSLFPSSWTFGNQLYIFATPTISAILYFLFKNPILSLSFASCIMTFFTIISFYWCIKPFTSKNSRIIGILCIIGGIILGTSAANDSTGLQLFYTMASYYSCYLIGIFYTIGIWFRILYNHSIRKIHYITCIIISFSLGIQSLRELLILSLPLFSLSVLISPSYKKESTNKKQLLFSLFVLIVSILGNAFRMLLISAGKVNQTTILTEANSNILNNISSSFDSFVKFTGLKQTNATQTSALISIMSVILVLLVIITLIDIIRKRTITPITYMIIYCVISLLAVYLAGILFINLRPHYYFVWRILTTLCIIYLAETIKNEIIRIFLLVSVLIISFTNYIINFGNDAENYINNRAFYVSMVNQLESDQISHIYYDNYSTFDAPIIGALSESNIICGTFFMNKDSFDPDNLLRPVEYLKSEEWFEEDNISNNYFLISTRRWEALKDEKYEEYKNTLLSHLTLVYQYTNSKKTYYFFKADNAIVQDLIN